MFRFMKKISTMLWVVVLLGAAQQPLFAQTALEWYTKGFNSTDFNLQIDYYTQAIEMGYSPLANAYHNRGFAKNNLGQYQTAILDFDKAIKLESNYTISYNNRGKAHYELGNYNQAIADYDKAIEVGGSSYDPYYKYREDAVAKRDALLADKTPPTMTITEPLLDARGLGVNELFEVQTTLRGIVTDASGIQTFQINGKIISLERDGSFTATVKLVEGDNAFVLRATDTKGNTAEKTITLHRAPTPVIEPMKPKPIIATPEKRLALLLGNSQYQQVVSLTNPANDVRAMEQKLKNLGFEVMTAVNLDKKQMQEQIRTFSRRLKDFEVGLLFYAGHGVEVDGINYLLPTDIPKPKDIIKADMPDLAIKTSYVENAMRDGGNENKTYILILDACRNDPFRLWRDVSVPDDGANWSPPKTVPSGFLTIYAASQGERAGDGTGSNGTFTSALLQHLATPCISIQSMLIRVRTELKKYQGIQEPEERSKLNKEFFFKACKN
jgi:Caspase domain/Glucodextranase, domain B/Tetratricopeptide repeat